MTQLKPNQVFYNLQQSYGRNIFEFTYQSILQCTCKKFDDGKIFFRLFIFLFFFRNFCYFKISILCSSFLFYSGIEKYFTRLILGNSVSIVGVEIKVGCCETLIRLLHVSVSIFLVLENMRHMTGLAKHA